MAVNCDPATLAKLSACYCFQPKIANSVMIYLLANKAGDTSTPAQLAAKAACYCFEPKVSEAVKTMLLCNIATAAGA
ncbi:MAG TPA: hypothetical protein VMQ76_06920 [Terracidiphilus sp.]|nr:hypothetical protein [Terracidiphilus sp.]